MIIAPESPRSLLLKLALVMEISMVTGCCNVPKVNFTKDLLTKKVQPKHRSNVFIQQAGGKQSCTHT